MRKAVFSIFTLRSSGQYSWWDDFPMAIGECLREYDIDHLYFYRDYTEKSKIPLGKRFSISDSNLKNPFRARYILKKYTNNYQKVIFHHHTPTFTSGLCAFNHKINHDYYWVTNEHDSWFRIRYSPLKKIARIMLRNIGLLPDLLIGCSEESRKRIRNLYGHDNVDFIYNGIILPDIPEPEPLNRVPVKALFVGRLEEYKGLWSLVKAFKLLSDTNVTLTIVGSGHLYKDLAEYISREDLMDKITLIGHSFDISEIMRGHDFAIIPSTYEECFSIVSVESQAHYLPCIYTDSGGMPETQIDGVTGIMVSKNNPEDIVKAVKRFQNNLDGFNQMRIAARRNAHRFSLETMARNYCRKYLEIFNILDK